MAAVTIRDVPDEVHRAIKVRAAKNGKSTEAEIRAILEEAVLPEGRMKLGSELEAFGRKYGPIEVQRDQSPVRLAVFE